MIKENLERVKAAIRNAALRSGRDPESVILVGVTKYAEVPVINDAIHAGLCHVAENRLQMAEMKFPLLDNSGQKIVKHMIGHLQTNKVKDVLQLFDLIHSVDSPRLVEEIQKRAAQQGRVAEILVQVDIAEEETKFGLPQEDLKAIFVQLEQCPNIRTLGLMTMAPITEDQALVRDVFRRCREHFEKLKAEYSSSDRIRMQHLSMGMSQDFEIAVEEGATLVRVGSAIFK